jgi:predicted Zn-dependent protease
MLDQRTRDLLLACRDRAARAGTSAEFLLHREKSSLIRLGNSSIALSTHEELTRLDVQVQDGRKVGSYTLLADITAAAQLDEALARAAENCAAALPKDYEPIFGVVEEPVDDSTGYDPALENLSSEAKSDFCARVVKTLKPGGKYDFSGSWSTGATERYCLTTANQHEAYRRLTDGRLVIVLKEQEKKWELSVERTQKRAGEFDIDGVIAEFQAMLPVYEKNPGHRTNVGRQKVLFGTQAVGELLGLALWSGFFGRMWEEKRAFTAGMKFGDRVFPENITITDDPTNPNVFGMPFDYKGKRRRPFSLVDKGIFKGLLYDTATAARYGRQPTGHDVDSSDLVFGTGTAPAGLAAGRKLAGDALYIPHLHYIHMPDPTKGMFTGSSRFNAQLVKGGEFVSPLVSSRVTDTIPQVLGHVVAISSRAVPVNQSSTYGRRAPDGSSVPEYIICEDVRISDVADSF